MGKIIELKGRHIPEVGLGNEEPIYPVTSVHALYVDNNDRGMQWSEWWGGTLGVESVGNDAHSGGERGRIWAAIRSISSVTLSTAHDIAEAIEGDTDGYVDGAIAGLGYVKTSGVQYTAGTGISITGNEIGALAASVSQWGVVRIGDGLDTINGRLNVSVETVQSDWNNGNPNAYGYIRNKPFIPSALSELTNDMGFITSHQDISGKVDNTLLGAANGVATLDDAGKVTSSQLPSYVDDVVEYASASGFPVPGEGGKIYVALNTNKTYRWSGTQYVEISASLALGETSSTAYRGDMGKVAYDHAQAKGLQFGLGLWKIMTNAQGHVVEAVHPVAADFAEYGFVTHDTTYDVATQGSDGLMSAADKTKLDGIMRLATSSDYNDILYNRPTIPTKTSELTNDSGFLTSHQSLAGYVPRDMLGAEGGVAELDLTGKVKASQLPSIPTKTSDLTNDSGFLTSHQDISGKVNKPSTNGTSGQVLATYGDGTTYWRDYSGGGGGGDTTDYADLTNKPQINSVTLSGNKSSSDLGLAAYNHTHDFSDLTNKPSVPSVITSWRNSPTSTDVVSEALSKGLKDAIDTLNADLNDFLGLAVLKEDKSNKVTSISASSTDSQYPSAKLLFDKLALKVDADLLGANSGVATLDSSGKVPSSQLPASTQEVAEYSTTSNFPATGVSGRIYIATSTGLMYRWDGTQYVSLASGLGLGTTSSTAYRGDYGNTAYLHATDNGRLSTAKSLDLYKIATTGEGHIAELAAVEKSDITALGIPAQDTTYELAGDGVAGLMSANDKDKLDGIAAGAEANVQSDWSQADNTKDDYIKNKPSLATVATSGSYSDLSDRPSFATVATSGSYNDLTNKPTIPTAVQSDWSESDNTNPAYVLNKPTINGNALSGNKSSSDLGLAAASHKHMMSQITDMTLDRSTVDTDSNGDICVPIDNSTIIVSNTKVSVNTSAVATRSWVGSQGYLTSHQDISGKVNRPSNGDGTSGQVLATNGDGSTYWVNQQGGGGGGTSDYTQLSNKPSIGGVTLSGNKTAADLSLAAASHTHTLSEITDFGMDHVTVDTDSNGDLCVPIDGTTIVYDSTSHKVKAVQVQADWNESDTSSAAYIENKPTIPAAQIQSDWNQSDSSSADYIKNRPAIPATSLVHDSSASINTSSIDFTLGASGNSLTYLDVSSAAASSSLVLTYDASTFCGRHRLVLCNESGSSTVVVTPTNDNGEMMMANPSTTWNVYVKGQQQGSDYLVLDVMFDRVTIGSSTVNMITYEAKYFSEIQ